MITKKRELIFNQDVPSFIKTMLYYVRELEFYEKPDYHYLIHLMQKMFHENGFKNDGNYEWK
jgi:hypothetical protein